MKIMTTRWLIAGLGAFLLSGCLLRIEVATPEKPININMNVKIEHEIRIRADHDIEKILRSQSDLF